MIELFSRLAKHPLLTFERIIGTLFVTLLNLASPVFVIQVLNRYISHGITGTLITLTALLEDKSNLAKAKSPLRESEDNVRHYNNSYWVEIQEQRRKAQQELNEFTYRMKKFSDNQSRTSIKAPVDGIVKTLYVDTRGGVIAPGRTIMDIVPTGDSLIVEAQLSIEDITSVKPGQDAVVKLSSRNARRVGKISGTVVHISPDALATEKGLTYYATRIKTDQDYFVWGEEHYKLIPGMGVAVFIHTGKRTVLEYLLDPFLDSISQGFQEK